MSFQSNHIINPRLSYWEQVSFFKEIDVAVIGSGIVGLSAAIHLKTLSSKLKVAVFERGSLPAGASTRNAGFACFGSMTELIDDLEKHSEDEVFDLVEKRWNGLERLREKIGDKKLGYLEFGGFELFKSDEEAAFQKCAQKLTDFNEKLFEISGKKTNYSLQDNLIQQFGFKGVSHLILNSGEGQIHTGMMMKSLLDLAKELGVELFTGINITDFEDKGNRIKLISQNDWEIDASKLIIATNGFAKQLIPELDVKPARNQVLITKPIDDLPFEGCFHYDKGYYYFRNIDQRILLGGGRNLAIEKEMTSSFGTTELIQNALIKLLKEVILPTKTFEIDTWWSGILGVGASKKTIVKNHSENVFLAVRMGGMGVAIGSLIGEEVAQLVYDS